MLVTSVKVTDAVSGQVKRQQTPRSFCWCAVS